MSVTIDRFKRVMSNGVVVSDALVTVRHNNTQQALTAIRAQMARVTQAGLEINPGFVTQVDTLERNMTAAMQLPTNQAKCEALDPIKLAFLNSIKQVTAAADEILADDAIRRQKGAEALAAVNRADQAIRQITDAAFRAPLAARLAGVQNRRINAVSATRGSQVKAAIPQLAACVTDADTIAADAVVAVQHLAERTTKLTAVNTAIAGLSAINATMADAAQKAIADRLAAALTLQRDALANAASDQVLREMARTPALLNDIATATATSNLRLAWSNTLARRNVIRRDATEYEAVGKKDGAAALESAAAKVLADLAKLETLSLANPKSAADQFPQLEADHNKLKADYARPVRNAKLLQSVADLIATNPNGPEAKMKAALGTDKGGNDLFNQRLFDVYDNPRLTATETTLLSPGEMVAIHSYTCPDYSQMNALLLVKAGKLSLPLPDYDHTAEPASVSLYEPTVDQADTKNQQAAAALSKMPNYTAGPTLRGVRKRYPNDDVDFKDGNVYTIPAFWSTSVTKAFRGPWHFTITGSSGKHVAMLSKYPTEDEVLYLPGTRFEVVSSSGVHSDANDMTCVRVVLKEV